MKKLTIEIEISEKLKTLIEDKCAEKNIDLESYISAQLLDIFVNDPEPKYRNDMEEQKENYKDLLPDSNINWEN